MMCRNYLVSNNSIGKTRQYKIKKPDLIARVTFAAERDGRELFIQIILEII